MIEQTLRPFYQRLLVNGPARWMSRFIGANSITLFSGILGLLILPAMLLGKVGTAIALLLLSGYCDTLDGTVARITHHSSPWGSVLDIYTDRFVEFMVIFSLWAVDPSHRSLGAILMLGSVLLCITSFLVVGIFSENHSQKSFHYSPGLMERAEAFVFFIVMMIWPQTFALVAALFSLLVVWTSGVRLREFYLQLCIQDAP